VSLHKPHADKQGFSNDYARLAGLNTITGGAGADVLTGGDGIDTFAYAAEATGEAQTGVVGTGVIDVITDFTTGTDKIGGFGVAGTGEFVLTAAGQNYASYAAALAGANVSIAGLNTDYVLSAYGAGGSWTAVVFIDIGAAGRTGAAAGAIQLGLTGAYASEAAAFAAAVASDFIA
jgi:Ca2+-binding RTX toxin-like protein